MKVTVKAFLNVRVGKPSVNAACYQYLAPGSEIEVDGTLYKGDLYEGTDTWYKDEAGNYYWSGGIESAENTVAANVPEWSARLNLPEIWKTVTGKGVGVAIVDTGIADKVPHLKYNTNHYYAYAGAENLSDKVGHGTHCAGLINSLPLNGITYCSAPDAALYICKIADSGSLNDNELNRYAEAINWCADQKQIKVISISWGSYVDSQQIINEMQIAINNAIKKNKIILCSIGNAPMPNDSSRRFPACLNDTIATGALPVQEELYPFLNKHLTLVLNGYKIPSFGTNGNIEIKSGTSQANAILAGIVCLIIEKLNGAFDQETIKSILIKCCTKRNISGTEFNVLDDKLLTAYLTK